MVFDGITRVMAELEEALELLDHDSRKQPGDRWVHFRSFPLQSSLAIHSMCKQCPVANANFKKVMLKT